MLNLDRMLLKNKFNEREATVIFKLNTCLTFCDSATTLTRHIKNSAASSYSLSLSLSS
jgi:hypothetical protein